MHHHTERFFQDQCSDEALEKIITWFQTPEGKAFLTTQMEKDFYRLSKDEIHRSGSIPTEKIFERIQLSKENPGRTRWILRWLSSFFLIASVFNPLYQKSLGMYGMMLARGISSGLTFLSKSYFF